MKIVCAWCGKDLGEKEPLEDKRITHGICEECEAKNFPDYLPDTEFQKALEVELEKHGFADNPGKDKEPVTVKCPICKDEVEIPQYNAVTRTDALTDHIKKEHGFVSSPRKKSRVPDTAKCTKCRRVFDLPILRERKDYEPGICPACGGTLRSIYERR